MSNVNAAFGFRPIRFKDGTPYSPIGNAYTIADQYADGIGTGDPILLDPTGSGTGGQGGAGVPGDTGLNITRTAESGGLSTGGISGVFLGCTFNLLDGSIFYRNFWPASQATFGAQGAYDVLVADSQDLVFEIQSDSNGLVPDQVGLYFKLNLPTAAPWYNSNGVSNVTVNGGDTNSSASADYVVQLIRLSNRPRNNQPNVYGAYAVGEFVIATYGGVA
jgi:hypothetical protein